MKRAISFFLTVAMVMSLCSSVLAVEPLVTAENAIDEKEQQIDELVEQIVQSRLEKWSLEKLGMKNNNSNSIPNADAINAINAHIDSCFTELERLGVTKVDATTVHALNVNTPIPENVEVSQNWDPYDEVDGVDFLIGDAYSRDYQGETYHYRILRCLPSSMNSPLNMHYDVMMENVSITQTFAEKIFGIYFGKAISSALTVIEWLPYELFFEDWSDPNRLAIEADYTIDAVLGTTAKYVYVADGSTDKNDQDNYYLSLLTHRVTTSETHVSSYYENNTPTQDSVTVKNILDCNYYNNPIPRAFSNFEGNSVVGQSYYEIIYPENVLFTRRDDNNSQPKVVKTGTPAAGPYNPDIW